jgi:hypothetical protein
VLATGATATTPPSSADAIESLHEDAIGAIEAGRVQAPDSAATLRNARNARAGELAALLNASAR